MNNPQQPNPQPPQGGGQIDPRLADVLLKLVIVKALKEIPETAHMTPDDPRLVPILEKHLFDSHAALIQAGRPGKKSAQPPAPTKNQPSRGGKPRPFGASTTKAVRQIFGDQGDGSTYASES